MVAAARGKARARGRPAADHAPVRGAVASGGEPGGHLGAAAARGRAVSLAQLTDPLLIPLRPRTWLGFSGCLITFTTASAFAASGPGGRQLAVAVPLVPRARLSFTAASSAGPIRLSRFTCLRRSGDRLAAESPLSLLPGGGDKPGGRGGGADPGGGPGSGIRRGGGHGPRWPGCWSGPGWRNWPLMMPGSPMRCCASGRSMICCFTRAAGWAGTTTISVPPFRLSGQLEPQPAVRRRPDGAGAAAAATRPG